MKTTASAAPMPDALLKLCDQLEGMKRTRFLMPGTGQHYSYLLYEDASAYIEEARKALAAPVAPAAPDDELNELRLQVIRMRHRIKQLEAKNQGELLREPGCRNSAIIGGKQ